MSGYTGIVHLSESCLIPIVMKKVPMSSLKAAAPAAPADPATAKILSAVATALSLPPDTKLGDLIAALQQLLPSAPSSSAKVDSTNPADAALSADQLAICKETGITAADFIRGRQVAFGVSR
jgi:hypothetical protein